MRPRTGVAIEDEVSVIVGAEDDDVLTGLSLTAIVGADEVSVIVGALLLVWLMLVGEDEAWLMLVGEDEDEAWLMLVGAAVLRFAVLVVFE